jgi:hypothetical protein
MILISGSDWISAALGKAVTISIAAASTARTSVIEAAKIFMSDSGVIARLIENTTSSGTNAAPSWNFTPGRS